jgi:hypothetical protein
MNYPRIALAAVAATVVDALYGFLVYGNLLTKQFAMFPGVYRAVDAQAGYMPILFCGVFIAMIGAAAMYAKGYEGGNGAWEGLRFGALIGLVAVGYSVVVTYAIANIGPHLAASLAVASFAEWVIAGVVIGLVYNRASR